VIILYKNSKKIHKKRRFTDVDRNQKLKRRIQILNIGTKLENVVKIHPKKYAAIHINILSPKLRAKNGNE
jgi:hypothetical protein